MSRPLVGAHPSELEFDLALVDGASAGFAAHLGDCARCRDRLARLRREQIAFANSDAPERAARAALAWRQQQERPRWRRWLWLPALTAVAAALLLFLLPREQPTIRTKGSPQLALFVKTSDGTAQPWSGAPLQSGDAVQLSVNPAGLPLVAIFSVDARCQVTLEHQQAVTGAALIPASWTVVGHDGGERLYVTFSTQPVAAATLAATLAHARACDRDDAPAINRADFVARGVALRPRARP
jgi:hypothetical protein